MITLTKLRGVLKSGLTRANTVSAEETLEEYLKRVADRALGDDKDFHDLLSETNNARHGEFLVTLLDASREHIASQRPEVQDRLDGYLRCIGDVTKEFRGEASDIAQDVRGESAEEDREFIISSMNKKISEVLIPQRQAVEQLNDAIDQIDARTITFAQRKLQVVRKFGLNTKVGVSQERQLRT